MTGMHHGPGFAFRRHIGQFIARCAVMPRRFAPSNRARRSERVLCQLQNPHSRVDAVHAQHIRGSVAAEPYHHDIAAGIRLMSAL